ncbi:hypothetical protein [Dactylosporangium sp. CA-139066]|uniref:hypothetical protein n=1 Tax=Dactylosporangium sp. CA-139066 TaxID=3239930 RepID=UPI003D8CB00A
MTDVVRLESLRKTYHDPLGRGQEHPAAVRGRPDRPTAGRVFIDGTELTATGTPR